MAAIDRLRDILEQLDGPATRERLRNERSKIEGSLRAEQAPQPTQGDTHDPAPPEEKETDQAAQAAAVSGSATVADSITAAAGSVAGGPITALLLTPSRKHAVQLDKNYESEPECLRLGHEVADEAILIAVATTRDLLAVARTAEWWKFKRFHGLYLLSCPEAPDVTVAQAMMIYTRGELKPNAPMTAWPDDKNPVRLADHILRAVKGRRVHLFAEKRCPGWEAIVGDENWVTQDSTNDQRRCPLTDRRSS